MHLCCEVSQHPLWPMLMCFFESLFVARSYSRCSKILWDQRGWGKIALVSGGFRMPRWEGDIWARTWRRWLCRDPGKWKSVGEEQCIGQCGWDCQWKQLVVDDIRDRSGRGGGGGHGWPVGSCESFRSTWWTKVLHHSKVEINLFRTALLFWSLIFTESSSGTLDVGCIDAELRLPWDIFL